MAFINIAEWTPQHVVQWLQGLEDCILPYVHFFLERQINGCRLLLLSWDDLQRLNITKIGHQELILDAVELLKHIHYGFHTETLQTLALKLGCKSRSLYNQMGDESSCTQCTNCVYNRKHDEQRLQPPPTPHPAPHPSAHQPHHHGHHQHHHSFSPADRLEPPFIRRACQKISTNTLSGVFDILGSVKQFIGWIDKYPFEGQDYYIPIRKTILAISIELASTAQRDRFVESPKEIIKSNCLTFAEICDRIVQELSDSLAIQPAVLEMVPIRKRAEEELGMNIHSSYAGIHVIGEIKIQSPTHRCGRVEEGDEIVQVNYQTVVGWQLARLIEAMREYPTEILLTIKKRPRHSNIIGQIDILKSYKIPQRKVCISAANSGSYFRESGGDLSRKVYASLTEASAGQPHKAAAAVAATAAGGQLSCASERSAADVGLAAQMQTVCMEDHDNNNICEHDSNENKQLFDRLSQEKPMTGPVYQLLQKPKRLRRRATISGSSPTTVCPPIRIEDLVSIDQKSSKRAAVRKSAEPRMMSGGAGVSAARKHGEELADKEFEKWAAGELVHPELLKKRKELIVRTYSDEVNSSVLKKRAAVRPDTDQSFLSRPVSPGCRTDATATGGGHANQFSSTIIDLNGGLSLPRKLVSLVTVNQSPAETLTGGELARRGELNGWINTLDQLEGGSSSGGSASVEASGNWKRYFFVLTNDWLYLFVDEARVRPNRLINLAHVGKVSDLSRAGPEHRFKVSGEQLQFLFASSDQPLCRSLWTKLKPLDGRLKATEQSPGYPSDDNLAQQTDPALTAEQSKCKKTLFTPQLPPRVPKLSLPSPDSAKCRSKFYLSSDQSAESTPRPDPADKSTTLEKRRQMPTPKPRISKLRDQNAFGRLGNSSVPSTPANPLGSPPFSGQVQSSPRYVPPEISRLDPLELPFEPTGPTGPLPPPKPARAREESIFYTTLDLGRPVAYQTVGSVAKDGQPKEIQSATSEEIQSIYTRRYNSSATPPQRLAANNLTVLVGRSDNRCGSPTSDHSLGSSSGISSYYSANYELVRPPHLQPIPSSCSPTTAQHLQPPHGSPLNLSSGSSAYVESPGNRSAFSPDAGDELSRAKPPKSPQRKSSFRLFSSPKMLKKFTSGRSLKEKPQPPPTVCHPQQSGHPTVADAKHDEPSGKPKSGGLFLNSPRLTRAFFGSRRSPGQTKPGGPLEKCSAACQTDESGILNRSISENSIANLLSISGLSFVDRRLAGGGVGGVGIGGGCGGVCSTAVGGSIGGGCSLDVPPTPDAARKPTMGVQMLSKRRASSVSTDRAAIEAALLLYGSEGRATQSQSGSSG